MGFCGEVKKEKIEKFFGDFEDKTVKFLIINQKIPPEVTLNFLKSDKRDFCEKNFKKTIKNFKRKSRAVQKFQDS